MISTSWTATFDCADTPMLAAFWPAQPWATSQHCRPTWVPAPERRFRAKAD